MKNKINKIFSFILLLIIIFSSITYAGFADFDDETADKQAQEDLKEQEEIDKETIGKSSNNYLKQIKIKDYKLVPEFDKQIINYEIKEELIDDELNIEAIPADNRAKVLGTGNIKLQSGENKIKIDVEAENGVKRTYFIKATKRIENIRLESIKLTAIMNDGRKENIDITPSFNKDIFEYNCQVKNNVKKIDVTASKNENYDIEIKGHENLEKVNNVITISIKTKDNKNEVIYKINVNKKEKLNDVNEEEKEYENVIKNNLIDKNNNKNIVSIITWIIIVSLIAFLLIRVTKKQGKH